MPIYIAKLTPCYTIHTCVTDFHCKFCIINTTNSSNNNLWALMNNKSNLIKLSGFKIGALLISNIIRIVLFIHLLLMYHGPNLPTNPSQSILLLVIFSYVFICHKTSHNKGCATFGMQCYLLTIYNESFLGEIF